MDIFMSQLIIIIVVRIFISDYSITHKIFCTQYYVEIVNGYNNRVYIALTLMINLAIPLRPERSDLGVQGNTVDTAADFRQGVPC